MFFANDPGTVSLGSCTRRSQLLSENVLPLLQSKIGLCFTLPMTTPQSGMTSKTSKSLENHVVDSGQGGFGSYSELWPVRNPARGFNWPHGGNLTLGPEIVAVTHFLALIRRPCMPFRLDKSSGRISHKSPLV